MTVVRRLTEGDGLQLLEDPVAQRLTATVRRDVVAFLADLASVSRPDRGAGVVGFSTAVAYPAGTIGSRINAILTGIGEGQPWADVDALVADLAGRLPTGALSSEVQDVLALVTANAAVAGSVSARIKAEADLRVADIQAEVLARQSAISAAVDGLVAEVVALFEAGDETVNSRITTEVGQSISRDSALGVRVDSVSARLDSGDIATSLAAAATYAYTKAAVDAALASTSSTLRAEFSGADDAIKARLNAGGDIATAIASAASYAYTKAAVDSALASTSNTLRAEFSGADDAIKARLNAGGDIATAIASAASYAYTKAAVDSALASTSNTLRAEFSGADDAIKARLNAGGDIATAIASAASYAYTKAAVDSALASTSTSLRTEFSSADNAIKARLDSGDIASAIAAASSYAYTKAAADSAIAASASSLYSSIAGPGGVVSAAVGVEASARATETGVLNAQWALKVVGTRSDGRRVFGAIGLASTAAAAGSGSESQIILQADRLLFVPSSNLNADATNVFELGTVNGVTTLTVPSARIGDLTVGSKALANNATSKVIGSTVAYQTVAQTTLVIEASDIPAGQATVPVTIIGSADSIGGSIYFDIAYFAAGTANWNFAGNLLAAQPPAGVGASVHVVALGVGTWVIGCYNHGGSPSTSVYDGNSRSRSVAVFMSKK